jgi:hypothetical protein
LRTYTTLVLGTGKALPARPHPNPSPKGEGEQDPLEPLSFRRGVGVRSPQ